MDFFVTALASLSKSGDTNVVGLDRARHGELLGKEIASIAKDIEDYLPKVTQVNSDCNINQYKDVRTKCFADQVKQVSALTIGLTKRRKSLPERLVFTNLQIKQERENKQLQCLLKFRIQFHIESEITKLKTARPLFYHFNDSNLDSYQVLLKQNDNLGNPVFILTPTIEEENSNFLRTLFSLNVS